MKRLLLLALAVSAWAQPSKYPQSNLVPAYGVDSGSVNALVVTLLPCPLALTTGLEVITLPANANTTTTPTLNVCGLGAKTITKLGTSAVAASDLTTTALAVLKYDGTHFQLQNPQTTGGGTLTSVTGTTNQIACSGTPGVTCSIPSTFIAPGSIQATTGVTSASDGVNAGMLSLVGNTSNPA